MPLAVGKYTLRVTLYFLVLIFIELVHASRDGCIVGPIAKDTDNTISDAHSVEGVAYPGSFVAYATFVREPLTLVG